MYTFKEFIAEGDLYLSRTREELEGELESILHLLEPPLCPKRSKEYGGEEEYKKMLLHKKKELQTALKKVDN